MPEPERLTELYFSQPNNLPTKYVPGGTQAINFTVHNLEYRDTTYQYQIIEQANDGSHSRTLASGNFTLGQNDYNHATVNIHTTDLGSRVKVEVELVNIHESIDYWVTREAHA